MSQNQINSYADKQIPAADFMDYLRERVAKEGESQYRVSNLPPPYTEQECITLERRQLEIFRQRYLELPAFAAYACNTSTEKLSQLHLIAYVLCKENNGCGTNDL